MRSNQPDRVETDKTVAHLFRHQSGRMTAVLARVFGLDKLDLIEDSIQDTMVKALKVWPFQGIPEKPEAWLIATARNRMIDQLRRATRSEPLADIEPESLEKIDAKFADELNEDVLRMMFACCDPRISPDSQVALTLKAVSGLSVREIAAAFLAEDESVAKLLTRAKQRLRNANLEIPLPAKLGERLEPVQKVLYLMFNEGYSTSNGQNPVRNDLCFEAIRLGKILAAHPLTAVPRVFAMLALFLFQTARLSARFDENGDFLRLSEQNRQLWDRGMIADGLRNLHRSADGDDLSEYHLEAEISSIHALAPDFASTDWTRISRCYDRLAELRPSAIVELNRAIALSRTDGPQAALPHIERLRGALEKYPLFFITLGELQTEAGNFVDAAGSFDEAYRLSGNDAMFRFLRRRMNR